jgi:hypothetical protein
LNDDVDFINPELLKPPSVRYTTAGKNDRYDDLAEDEKQAEIDISDDVTFGDRELASGLNVTGAGIRVAGVTREFYVHPVDDDMIYVDCPLCGSHSCIYGGNRFYTQACCYFDRDMGRKPEERENISLQAERWTTEQLLAGESIDEVHAKLTALRSGRTPTRRDYVERIHAILNDTRTADAYKHYLESGDDGSKGAAGQEQGYYANEDSILTAEEDIAHEKAADAVERQSLPSVKSSQGNAIANQVEIVDDGEDLDQAADAAAHQNPDPR